MKKVLILVSTVAMFALSSTSAFAWGVMGSTSGDVMSGAHTESASIATTGKNGYSVSGTRGGSWNNTSVKASSCVRGCGGSAGVMTSTNGGTSDSAFNYSSGAGWGAGESISSQHGWADGTADFRTRFMW